MGLCEHLWASEDFVGIHIHISMGMQYNLSVSVSVATKVSVGIHKFLQASMGLWADTELEKSKSCADTYLSCRGLKCLQSFTRSMVVKYSLMSQACWWCHWFKVWANISCGHGNSSTIVCIEYQCMYVQSFFDKHHGGGLIAARQLQWCHTLASFSTPERYYCEPVPTNKV